jgi:FtsZ-binding cell division protein ZapB
MEIKEAINKLNAVFDWCDSKFDTPQDFLKLLREEIIRFVQSLEAENKALKKENQAYREMWKSICGYINNFHKDSTTSGILDTRKVIGRIEQKYLGGGK